MQMESTVDVFHRQRGMFISILDGTEGSCLAVLRVRALAKVTSIKASFSALLWSTVLLFAVLASLGHI